MVMAISSCIIPAQAGNITLRNGDEFIFGLDPNQFGRIEISSSADAAGVQFTVPQDGGAHFYRLKIIIE